MQDLIRHGGSGGDTISVKKVIHIFHQQPLKFKNVGCGPWTVVCELFQILSIHLLSQHTHNRTNPFFVIA